MLVVKAFHIIAMVAWFAGIFYLPRLFVYHAMSTDPISLDRFVIMERKLYYGIMAPSAIATLLFGGWLLSYNSYYYLHATWFLIKLSLVGILIAYHIYCGYLLRQFKFQRNRHSHQFYRVFNELPVVLLVLIVLLVCVR